jgi:hypothetical protein
LVSQTPTHEINSLGAFAVQTANCSTYVVSSSTSGQVQVKKFDGKGQADVSYGQSSVYEPFFGRYPNYHMGLFRLVLLDQGFLAVGFYAKDDGASAMFAFRLTEDGVVDANYGPRRDGVIMGGLRDGVTVTSIDAPTVQPDGLTFPISTSAAGGVVNTTLVHVSTDGRDAMPADRFPMPSTCSILNITGNNSGITYNIQQSACSALSWTALGPNVKEQFVLPTDGTPGLASLLGDFAAHYDGADLKMITRDGLGHIRDQYVSHVKAQDPKLCDTDVQVGQEYLVFSDEKTGEGDWLTNCWFL